MVRIKLEDCKNCTSLPPLGQLCSLKELYIQGMSAIKHVGDEFYGQPQDRCEPFSKLEILCFENMPEWQDWFAAFGVVEELQPFASVSKLSIGNCPKLLGKLPSNLLSLKELKIFKCQKLLLEVSSLFFPSLTSLTLDGIKLLPSLSMHSEMRNTIEPNFLSSLCIRNISMPDSFYNISICNEEEISANSPFRHLGSVTHLTIYRIQKLGYLPKWLSRELTGLEQLDISDCEELRTLALKNNHEEKKLHHHFPALQKLCISYCPQLVSLYEQEEEENDEESEGQQEHEGIRSFMLSLESLCIKVCGKLEKLPRGLNTLTSLVDLRIEVCPKLVTFPETCFPSTLRTLYISNCDALESPLLLWNSLERLSVVGCPSLTSLTLSSVCSSSRGRGGLPLSLQFLHIWNCGNLESLVVGEEEEIKINCPSLETVKIQRCASLKYLPNTLNNKSLGELRKMRIEFCENLQYLLGGWFHAITKLRSISIHGCRKLRTLTSLTGRLIGEGIRGERVVSCILKEAGFFTNLTSLDLRRITVGMHQSEWDLHRLSSLVDFLIQGPIHVAREEEEEDGGGEVVEVSIFPLDGMFLPSSLISLGIYDFPDLKRLSSKGFECLSSLETLQLRGCPRLAYLPENGGLPSSRLHIVGSPILAKRCEREKGHYWPFISHIPTLILA